MKPTIHTRPANDNATVCVSRKAAREFRALRLTVFGKGARAEHAAADSIRAAGVRCCHRTLQNWEGAHTPVPHAAVLVLRGLLREVAA